MAAPESEALEASPGDDPATGGEEGAAPVYRQGVPREPRRRAGGLIYGARVKNVTTHPAFQNVRPHAGSSLRRAPRRSTGPASTCSPSPPERAASRTGISGRPERGGAGRRRATRSPRGPGSPTAGWAARQTTKRRSWARSARNAEFYAPYQANARRWYHARARARAVRQPRDHPSARRSQHGAGRDQAADRLRARRPRRPTAAITSSGAKVVATGSALTNYTFVAHHGLIPLQDKNFALVFMVPTNAPGVKLICRARTR